MSIPTANRQLLPSIRPNTSHPLASAACITVTCFLLFSSCTKTRYGNLPYYAATAPKTVVAGSPIRFAITLEVSTDYRDFHFYGFVTEVDSIFHYRITAPFEYRIPWWQTTSGAMDFFIDTSLTLKTKIPGRYIFNFTNGTEFNISDTVDVR